MRKQRDRSSVVAFLKLHGVLKVYIDLVTVNPSWNYPGYVNISLNYLDQGHFILVLGPANTCSDIAKFVYSHITEHSDYYIRRVIRKFNPVYYCCLICGKVGGFIA